MENKMRVRKHCGMLSDSLETTVEIDRSMDALVKHVADDLDSCPLAIPNVTRPLKVTISKVGFDDRCGWDTYYVVVDGLGCWGMIDGAVDAK